MALLPNPSEDETSTEGNSTYTDKERGMLQKTEVIKTAENPECHCEQNHCDDAVEERRALRRRRIFFGGGTGVCEALFGHINPLPKEPVMRHRRLNGW